MLNIEKYKNEIEKIGIDAIAVNEMGELKRCRDVYCRFCVFRPNGESYCNTNKTEWLCKEYKEPEIDWDNDIDWEHVPVDTDVLVSDSCGMELRLRKFVVYLPNTFGKKYIAFANGAAQSDANDVCDWAYCKLANPEDIEKYRKR